MKISRIEKTVFHLIPYCCAETVGCSGLLSGKNFLWLWWMFCFEPRFLCVKFKGEGRFCLDIAGCTFAICPDCDGLGWRTQKQVDADALVKAYPLLVPLHSPSGQNARVEPLPARQKGQTS